MHTDTFSATLRERYKARQQQKQARGSKRIATAVASATEPSRPRKQKAKPKPRRPQQRREYVKKERICQSCNEPFNPKGHDKYCGKEECQAAKVEVWRENKRATDAARYQRTRKVHYEPRICMGCDKEFVPKRVDQTWCSDHACQNKRRNETKKAWKV